MNLAWIRTHKWKLLLAGIVLLLLISPIARVYDDQDGVISPVMAELFLAVAFGCSRHAKTLVVFGCLIFVWLIISLLTEGSGIFVGKSLVAPLLFLILLGATFGLLIRWLISAVLIDSEVLCAALCGYLLIGLLWTGLDSLAIHRNPKAFQNADGSNVTPGDLLYFSYSTLTTIGFGDITPKAPVIRMATIMEAIVGIFYNIIVIARFVGLYGLRPRSIEPPVPGRE